MICEKIEAAELCLSKSEAAQRLSVPRDFDSEIVERVKKDILSVIDCRMAAVRVPVSVSGSEITLGDMKLESENLSYALGESKEAFIFAVTLGMGVERALLRLSRLSVSEHFIADALASAYAEAAADCAQEMLNGYGKTKKRFSPGYGDLPLEIQPQVLSMLEADKTLGLTVTDSLLMKPQKSITAIVGIENE